METTKAEIVASDLEIKIEGSRDAVWRALTTDIGAWWPAEFYAGGEAGKRTYTLETHPGGRMMEKWQGGGGVLWGTVVTVEPGALLQVVGTTFPNWGGPSQWFGTWKLETQGDATLLSFNETTLGRVDAAGVESKSKGWQFLFGGVLKAFVEGRPIPPWEEGPCPNHEDSE